MKYKGVINDYIAYVKDLYIDKLDEEMDWYGFYKEKTSERRKLEHKYTKEIDELESLEPSDETKEKVTFKHIEFALDSFVCRKEELFAYANHMSAIGRKKIKQIKEQNFCFEETHKFTLKVDNLMDKTSELLEAKTKVAKKILLYAALFDNDANKVYSEDKYEKIEESIDILEGVLKGVMPEKQNECITAMVKTQKFCPQEFINDTSDNPLMKSFNDVVGYKKDINEFTQKTVKLLKDSYENTSSTLKIREEQCKNWRGI